jgi:hypothetical protein
MLEELGETREGDVTLRRIDPFTVYPDNINNENLEKNDSILIAETMFSEEAYLKYNIPYEMKKNMTIESTSAITRQPFEGMNTVNNFSYKRLENQVMIFKFMQRPNESFPKGRFVVSVGDVIVFDGDLPFDNGVDYHKYKTRDFPLTHISTANSPRQFFGDSLIKDIIPIQKKLNAVRDLQFRYLEMATFGQ